jgi:predicted RNA-binding Zn ribbon-like protein
VAATTYRASAPRPLLSSPLEPVIIPPVVPDFVTCQTGDVLFEFVAGNLALDFVATVAERGTTDLEHLRTGDDLRAWIRQAGLLDAPPRTDLEPAIELREALFVVIAALVDDRPPPRRALAVVNTAAAAPPPVPRASGGAVRREGDIAAALSAIARDGLALFELDDPAALRFCADEHCTRPFLDRSRGGRRRWCGMAGCGDRAKAAAYRARRRGR